MADDASDDRDDSDIELDVPEWGSSSDEEGGCLPYSDDIDANGETSGADGPLCVAAGVSSGARNTALERRGVVVAVGVHGEPSIRERDVLEARVRQVTWPGFVRWGAESGWTHARPSDDVDSDVDASVGATTCERAALPSTTSTTDDASHARESASAHDDLPLQLSLLLCAVVDVASAGSGEGSAEETELPSSAARQIEMIDGVCSASVWVCAPCVVPVAVHSVESLTATDATRVAALLRDVGVAVVPPSLGGDVLTRLSERVRSRISQAEAAIGARHPSINLGVDEFVFHEMASRGGQRFDLLLELSADELSEIDAGWREGVAATLACDPSVLKCQISAVYSRPGAPDQDWHSDGAHIDVGCGWDGEPQASAYAVCAFVPLIDLTHETGYTSFWPGSHCHPGLLGFGPAATAIGCEVDGVLRAGSCVLYDYRLLHRGRANTGKIQRELVQLLYSRDYSERKNYGSERLLETP